jgi:GntR family transcriptional regulator, trigonelline degradation regulator
VVVRYYSMTSSSSQPPPNGAATLSAIPRAAAPLRRQVVDELRQSIISGRLGPGVRLVERELIAMMGVSRTVIREALRQLESEGLIAMIPNKGPIVRELTLVEAKDLYSIRAVLEGLAARLFVQNADEAQFRKLQTALTVTAAAYKAADPEVLLGAKNRFYDVLFEGAGSETLSSMIATLHARIRRWRALGLAHPQRSPRRSQESMKSLRAVVAAIKARDAEQAEKVMRDEVTRAAAEIIRLLANSPPQAAAQQAP